MNTQQLNVPANALMLSNKQRGSVTSKDSVIEMTAYSGGVIKNHFYWGNLIIDLSGMSFPKKKYPILENHDTDRKIGFTKNVSVNGSLFIVGDFVDTPESQKFKKLSKEGFPYEASIYAIPTSIKKIEEGEKVKVNGMTVEGPASIWQRSIFRECSCCTFGFDQNTESRALSQDHLKLSLNVNGNFEVDEDDLLANEIFALSGSPNATLPLSNNDEFNDDDEADEALANEIFASSGQFGGGK